MNRFGASPPMNQRDANRLHQQSSANPGAGQVWKITTHQDQNDAGNINSVSRNMSMTPSTRTDVHSSQYQSTQNKNIQYRTVGESSHYDDKIRFGKDVVVGHREHVGQDKVVSERIVEHSIRVPKRVMREDYIEKLIIVPEKIVHEEIIDDYEIIKEKIIEVIKPIIHEKIVEYPEYEYVDKIVEVPQTIVQEKITEVPRMQIQERIIEIPRIITQEKIVEVPEIEYKIIPIEKIVEVPEIREQVVTKEIPVTQYVDKPFPEYVTIEDVQNVERFIPVPVEAEVTYEYAIPTLKPRYHRVDVPLYVPRFIEIPVHAELMDDAMDAQMAAIAKQVALVGSQQAASLCEVEDVAAAAKGLNFDSYLQSRDAVKAFQQAYENGTLSIGQPVPGLQSSAFPKAARLQRDEVSHEHHQHPVYPTLMLDPTVQDRLDNREKSGYKVKSSPSKVSSPSRRSRR